MLLWGLHGGVSVGAVVFLLKICLSHVLWHVIWGRCIFPTIIVVVLVFLTHLVGMMLCYL